MTNKTRGACETIYIAFLRLVSQQHNPLHSATGEMATLTPVSVALPEDKVPTKQNVQDIISSFLTMEWPAVDSESLTMTYHASFANAHCLVHRPKPNRGTPIEPLDVFIKFHRPPDGDIEIFSHLVPSKAEEALLCYEYGRSGMGAQVYGFFKTLDGTLGRIDEFLDACNLEPMDVENAMIRADVARALASFHIMDTSLNKRPVHSYYEAILRGLKKYHKMNRLKALGWAGGVPVDELVEYDFVARIQNVVKALETIGGKTAWCIHDVQYMNVMVKHHPMDGGSRVVLIDFECVMRNYRALDIGGHFMHKMFQWYDEENKVVDCSKYTEEEKRHFCDEYAKQWNDLTGGFDTGDQVFLESEYGYMLAITFDIHNMLWFMDKEGDKDPLNLLALNKLHHEFIEQYSKLHLEES